MTEIITRAEAKARGRRALSVSPEIITLQEARARGLKHYRTGVPCKRGHVGLRRLSDNHCLECQRLLQRQPPEGKRKVAEQAIAEARALGHKMYFTGFPCQNGHLTFRWLSDNHCLECKRLSANNYRKRHLEQTYLRQSRYTKTKLAIYNLLMPKKKPKRSNQWYLNNKERLSQAKKMTYARATSPRVRDKSRDDVYAKERNWRIQQAYEAFTELERNPNDL